MSAVPRNALTAARQVLGLTPKQVEMPAVQEEISLVPQRLVDFDGLLPHETKVGETSRRELVEVYNGNVKPLVNVLKEISTVVSAQFPTPWGLMLHYYESILPNLKDGSVIRDILHSSADEKSEEEKSPEITDVPVHTEETNDSHNEQSDSEVATTEPEVVETTPIVETVTEDIETQTEAPTETEVGEKKEVDEVKVEVPQPVLTNQSTGETFTARESIEQQGTAKRTTNYGGKSKMSKLNEKVKQFAGETPAPATNGTKVAATGASNVVVDDTMKSDVFVAIKESKDVRIRKGIDTTLAKVILRNRPACDRVAAKDTKKLTGILFKKGVNEDAAKYQKKIMDARQDVVNRAYGYKTKTQNGKTVREGKLSYDQWVKLAEDKKYANCVSAADAEIAKIIIDLYTQALATENLAQPVVIERKLTGAVKGVVTAEGKEENVYSLDSVVQFLSDETMGVIYVDGNLDKVTGKLNAGVETPTTLRICAISPKKKAGEVGNTTVQQIGAKVTGKDSFIGGENGDANVLFIFDSTLDKMTTAEVDGKTVEVYDPACLSSARFPVTDGKGRKLEFKYYLLDDKGNQQASSSKDSKFKVTKFTAKASVPVLKPDETRPNEDCLAHANAVCPNVPEPLKTCFKISVAKVKTSGADFSENIQNAPVYMVYTTGAINLEKSNSSLARILKAKQAQKDITKAHESDDAMSFGDGIEG